MKTYESFIFSGYEFDPKEAVVKLHYSLDDEIEFTETLELAKEGLFSDPKNQELLDRVLFMLHLIGGISYYKTCLPKRIEIRSGKLTKDQAEFWNTVYQKGLAEFYFQNNITDHQVEFPAEETDEIDPLTFECEERTLVPMGGGKDSIVTAELLKASQIDSVLFRMGSHPLIDEAVKISGLPCITIERTLSPKLFELNDEGALNGHIPITAYLSIATILISVLHGFTEVAMSNERSASEGNTKLGDLDVNHQWSKSLEFERMFQKYLRENITPDIRYFSLLRQFSELSIVNLFVNQPQYFEAFTSCNANWRIAREKPAERWIAEPKTAFVFTLFAGFLGEKNLMKIFGQNFFEDESLLPTYRELLGLEGIKPFECVGTPEETTAAFLLALQKGDLNETPVMEMFLTEMGDKIEDPGPLVAKVLDLSDEHSIPPDFLNRLNVT